MTKYFVKTMGDEHGPFSATELVEMAKSKEILPESHVREDGGKWVPATSVKGLEFYQEVKATIQQVNPPPVIETPNSKKCPFCAESIAYEAIKCKHCQSMLEQQLQPKGPPVNHPALTESKKKVLPNLILVVFFGIFGMHAFYSGRIRSGFVSLLFLVLGIIGGILANLAVQNAHYFMFMGGLLFVPALLAFVDFIHILTANYTDGEGKKITRWT